MFETNVENKNENACQISEVVSQKEQMSLCISVETAPQSHKR
jgi:hypothetical protein